jgi:hypothetical protein
MSPSRRRAKPDPAVSGEIAARMASPQVRVALERVAARPSARVEGATAEAPSESDRGTTDRGDDELTAVMARVDDG